MLGSTATAGLTPAAAAPGNPGVPSDAIVLFHENFENRSAGSRTMIGAYTGVSGNTYTAQGFWNNAASCNGMVLDSTTPWNGTDCSAAGSAAQSDFNGVKHLARVLGQVNGSVSPGLNGAVAAYSDGTGVPNQIEFATAQPLSLPQANGRFVTFSVNAAATNCRADVPPNIGPLIDPKLAFYLRDASGTEIPAFSTPINPCTGSAYTIPATPLGDTIARAGTYVANGSVLLSGGNFDVVMRNVTGTGSGNDHAFDDIRVLDVTPQLDKSFSPESVPVGGTTRLTLTITNTSELAEKNGWSFTDNLPDGLVVADEPNMQTTCDATVNLSPGGSSVEVIDGVLVAGESSCAISLDVTSESPTGAEASPREYANCAENISPATGVDLPQCATVEFYSETALEIAKQSDATIDSRTGDTVTYTVTAKNVGTADFTTANPAVVIDDLAGVIDDADYQDDAAADHSGEINYTEPRLSWSGPLPAGETVTLTYTVVLKAGGDREVRNVAFVGDPEEPDKPVPDCTPDATDVACTEFDLPALLVYKSGDRATLPRVGEQVTYVVSVDNPGPGSYTDAAPATASDDLSDVLDDATLNPSSLTALTGTVVPDGEGWKWTGPLAAGESVWIRYTVTYTGEGDHVLRNVACVPESEVPAGGQPCTDFTIPGADLKMSKESVPSATPLETGDYVDYTLWFDNGGAASATVDDTDYLGYVLDDAEIVDGPAAGVGNLTATLTGDKIRIVGEVPAGERYSVTYRVQVKPETDRGDNLLVNHLLTGDPTDPPEPPNPGGPCVDTITSTCNPLPEISYEKTITSDTAPVVTGSVLKYTVTITNTGETAGAVSREDVLADVLDDATLVSDPESDTDTVTVSDVTDERFTIGGTLAAGATATVTYEVRVNSESHRGNNTADNFLVLPGEEPPTECVDGDVECTSTPMPRIVAGKTADPTSGATVQAGQNVTYTLTFTNDGTAAGPLDYTDDLAGVLDDADLAGPPTASSSAIQVTDGADGTVRVTGDLAAGETVTVEYTVTVKADADRGDDRLQNVILKTGTDECVAAEDATCSTEHLVPRIIGSKTVNPASGTPVVAGQELVYTLTFENVGTGTGSVAKVDDLTHVLDDADLVSEPVASNSDLQVSRTDHLISIAGELVPGQRETVTYTVKVRTQEARGDDILANFLLKPGTVTPPEPECEVDAETCTMNPIGEIVPSKTVDPETGTKVGSGDTLTYTLSFTNTGKGSASIDYVDHMGDVLDDAVLQNAPVASPGLLVSGPDGGKLHITGTVAPGETATVVYQVKVKEYNAQKNHHLGNFLTLTDQEPPSECVSDNPLCTKNPIDPPKPGLALTGAGPMTAAAIVGLLILLGGSAALLLGARRRRIEE